MKIGIVCYPTVGGSGIVATELGHALALRGHEVHFITYDIPFRLKLDIKNLYFHEVEIEQYELFRYPDYALPLAVKIAEVSKQFDLDLIHVHYAIPHATSAYIAKQIMGTLKPKIITTLHGTDITLVGKEPAYFDVVKFSIDHSDALTAVSNNLKQEMETVFHIDKPCEIIYNFFIPRPDLIGTKPFRQLFVTDDEKLMVHASNFRSVKKAEDAVHVLNLVRKKVPCKLLFLGSGSGLETVRHVVKELKLDDFVYFIGQSRYVDPYLTSGDLFILPSHQESFGLAALEAMAYGLPVIATNVGGLPEVIDDGETGYLCEPSDITAMAQHAVRLLTDPDAYQKMSHAAMESAASRFNVDKIVPQYEDLYNRTVKSK